VVGDVQVSHNKASDSSRRPQLIITACREGVQILLDKGIQYDHSSQAHDCQPFYARGTPPALRPAFLRLPASPSERPFLSLSFRRRHVDMH
jgi:hypothetical protein